MIPLTRHFLWCSDSESAYLECITASVEDWFVVTKATFFEGLMLWGKEIPGNLPFFFGSMEFAVVAQTREVGGVAPSRNYGMKSSPFRQSRPFYSRELSFA